jgi:hypothetical protein
MQLLGKNDPPGMFFVEAPSNEAETMTPFREEKQEERHLQSEDQVS